MAATAGKVALVLGTTTLPAASCPGDDGSAPFNPNNSTIVDFVGYGSTANCYEGSGPTTPNFSGNVTSVSRKSNGCQDTNDNAADFSNTSPPTPRNTSSTPNVCP
jgi:hypothetical protein